jgi:arylsulfatase A
MANWKGNAPEGAACDDLIDFTDFFPTLLDAAGANAPSGLKLDGQSFLSQLVGEKGNPRDWIFCHYDPRWGNFPK